MKNILNAEMIDMTCHAWGGGMLLMDPVDNKRCFLKAYYMKIQIKLGNIKEEETEMEEGTAFRG